MSPPPFPASCDLRLALYEPDIPQNTGTLLRAAACLGFAVELIEPAGFAITDKNLRRAGLDYLPAALLTRHASWTAFESWRASTGRRLILLTTRADASAFDFVWRPDDVILVGRESAGVPETVHRTADARLKVPMRPGFRSLNVALTAAMVMGQALAATGGLPPLAPDAAGP